MNWLRDLEKQPWGHDFYLTLRRFECLHANKPRIGQSLRPADDALRLGQEPALDFAPAAISAFKNIPGRPPRLEQRFFGLLGPNGPLPLHLTEYTRERLLHKNDATLARFLDIFHHRFLSLFYRAWAQAQPTVNLDRPKEDRFALYIGALAGLGSPSQRNRDAAGDHVKLFFSGLLSRQVRNRDGLEALLAGFFRLPVKVESFVGHWLSLPASEWSRLGAGTAAARLGLGAVLGSRIWDRQHKFRLHLGPLSLEEYRCFLPGGAGLPKLVALVRQYLSMELEWDVRLILAKNEAPKLSLGGGQQLGLTSWLGREAANRDKADLTLDAERMFANAARAARKEINHV